MFELGPHAHFIISAYAMVAIVIAGMIFWVTRDERKQQKLLDDLEAQGITRRSARNAGEQE